MPASSTDSCDPIEQSLQASLSNDQDASISATLDKQLLCSAKKVLLSKVEFQPAEKEYSFTLQNLKTKYIHLNPDGDQTFKKSNVVEMNSGNEGNIRLEDDGIPAPNVMIHPPNKITLGWQRVYRIGAGLANLGNTCFLNATLQCLTYTPPLVNHLIEFDEHVTNCKNVGFCMMCELYRHIRRALEKNGETIKPQCILQKLKAIAKHMVWGRQEDAHEFLRYMMESMIKSSLKGYSTASLDRISLETTVVNHIFGGYHRSQVICLRCKEKSDTYDHFMDIILDIKNVPSLEKAMEKFVQPEILDNENSYMCPRCKRKCQAQKRFTVHRAPNIATFQLKRFDYNRMVGGKITKHVTFPEKLDMRPFMSQKQGLPVMFQLYAVLVHQGVSCNSGHYFCFVRNSNNLWYIMDDCKVRQVSLNFVLNQQAYLLFYTRVPNNSTSFSKNCNLQSSSTSIYSNSMMNGVTKYSLENSVTSAKKSNTNGNNPGKLKPLNSVSSPPLNNSGSSSILIPLLENRERVSFGIKPLGWQQQSLQQPEHSTQKHSLMCHQNGSPDSEENEKRPRIVMHIKNGKVTNMEQQWLSGVASSENGETVSLCALSSSPSFTEQGNRITNLVPYIPDSSEESDNENKSKISSLQYFPTIFEFHPNRENCKSLSPNKQQQQQINQKTNNHNHLSETTLESNGINVVNERSKPLAIVTGGCKVKATSSWMVTDCQQSPSVASEGSNNSVNSTMGWKVIDRDKDETPKIERHYGGWTITPKEKEKTITSFLKDRTLLAKNNNFLNNSHEEIRYYDDNSKLLRQRSIPSIVKYHSDTETHDARKVKVNCVSSPHSTLKKDKINRMHSHKTSKCQMKSSLRDISHNNCATQENENVMSIDTVNGECRNVSNGLRTSDGAEIHVNGVSSLECSNSKVNSNNDNDESKQKSPPANSPTWTSVSNTDPEPVPVVNGYRSESLDEMMMMKRHKKHKKHRRDHEECDVERQTQDLDSNTSDESSQKTKKKKKKHKRHHDERHWSDSSSDYELEWVERTKETLEKEKQVPVKYWDESRNNRCRFDGDSRYVCSNKGRHWDSPKMINHSVELIKQSIHSYGNGVVTWDGECNQIDRDLASNLKHRKRYSDDYDDEYDRGRTRKMRFHERKYFDPDDNPFQRMQDKRSSDNKCYQDVKNSKFSPKMFHYERSRGNKFHHSKNTFDSKFKYYSNHKL